MAERETKEKSADPKPAKEEKSTPSTPRNRSIMDDLVNVSINEFMPAVVKWLLDLVPSSQYETIFQEKAKYWKLALPLLNYFTLRVFDAPKVVDDLSTDFFAQLRREIDIRAAGIKDDGNKPVGSAVQTENLLRLFLMFPENLEIYRRIILGKEDWRVKQIRSFLNTMTPDELIAFFGMNEAHKETLLATFVAKGKETKSLGKLLAELKQKIVGSWIAHKAKEIWATTSFDDVVKPINTAGEKTADAIKKTTTDPLQGWVNKQNKSRLRRLLW